MIEEQRKNKYKDCKIWVKQVYFLLRVIVDSRKVCGSMTLWKIFGMYFISCSSLSLWTVQFWTRTRDLSPQDREGRFIHLERTGSERFISIKKAEGRRVSVSWRKKWIMRSRDERGVDSSIYFFKLTGSEEGVTPRDTEAYTRWMYLEELKSTEPKILPALSTSVCPRDWCCKSDTSLGFDMLLDLTWFAELSIQ